MTSKLHRWAMCIIVVIVGLLLPTSNGVVKAQEVVFSAQVNNFFTPTTIAAGGISQFTITITNPNNFPLTLSSIPAAISNALPSGVVFASPANAATTCVGGTVSTVGSTLYLIGGTVPANGASYGICTVTVNVTSTIATTHYNTIAAEALNATDPTGTIAVTNQTESSTNLVVSSVAPPSLSKTIAPNTLWVGQSAVLKISITNNDLNYALTHTGLTDTLPANVVVAQSPGITFNPANCGSPTVTANQGGGTIIIANASIPKTKVCDVSVNITSSVAGVYMNTIPARAITTDQGVTNASAASAPVNFQSIGISKVFSVGNMQVGGTATMTVTIQNPTQSPYTNVSFSDTLPSGLSFVSATAAQCGGTVSLGSGNQILTLTGGTVAAGTPTTPASCTVTATLTGSVAGNFTNTIPAGALSTGTQGVTNVIAATRNISVYNAGEGIYNPSKSFSPATIPVGGVSTLTINVRAPADTSLTGFNLNDALPVGVKVANPPTPTKNANCQGGTFNPAAGDTLVTYSGGTIPANQQCTLTVKVTAENKGIFTNTISAANISNSQGRNITGSFSANLTVSGLSVSKAFYPGTVNVNGISTLTVTLTNTNSVYLESVNFTDTLPNNVRLAMDPKASTTCGGSLVANSGAQSFSLSGGILPAQVGSEPGVCTVNVNVVGVTTGTNNNTIALNAVKGTLHGSSPAIEVSNPSQAQVPITVANLTIGVVKEFALPGQVNQGSSSRLTVTLTNENAVLLTGIKFTDTLPLHPTTPGAQLLVADPANALEGDCGGKITIAPDRTAFTFDGGTLAANAICSLSIDITSNVRDGLTNRIEIGSVTSTNGAANPRAAVATLNNIPGAVVIKKFLTNPMPTDGQSILQISIQNVASFDLTNVGIYDVLPAGVVPVNQPLTVEESQQCGGTLAYNSETRELRLTEGVLEAESTCLIRVPITSASAGTYENCIVAGALTNTDGFTNDRACDSLVVEDMVNPPTITKQFLSDPVKVGEVSPIRFTISNPNPTPLTGVGFTDPLPTGLVVSSPPNPSQCGGLITVTQDPDTLVETITLANGRLAANGSCTITVGSNSATGGLYNNVTSEVTSLEGGDGGTASDTLTVIAPPTILKSFSPDSITRGFTSTLTFVVSNPEENTVALTGVAFTDLLPAGLVVADPVNANASASCGSPTFAPLVGATSLVFTGGTLQPDASGDPVCVVSVDVTAPFGGTYNNETLAVTSTNGGTGTTASDTLTVQGVGLALLKTSTAKNFTAAEQTITYDYLLTNTGTATLYAPFTITDDKITGAIDCGNLGSVVSLEPGGTTTCFAEYDTSADDVSAKWLTNTATATAMDAAEGGGEVTSNSSSVTLPLARLTLDKTTTSVGYRLVNDRIDYTYTVTNTGSVNLYGPFEISDDHFSNGTKFACGSATILPPSGVTVCSKTGTYRYTVTSDDVAAGLVTNRAVATGYDAATSGILVSSNTDSVTVRKVVGPEIDKVFSPNPIAVGGTSLLTFTITNPNEFSSLSGVGFTDTFPSGMTKVTDPSAAQCGGTITSTASSITLAGGFIIPAGTCTVTILVTAAVPNSYPNLSGTVTSTNGGNGDTAADTLIVLDAPVITKTFNTDTINEFGTSVLTLTISNPAANTRTLTGVIFSDTFPAGLTVKEPLNFSLTNCGQDAVFEPESGDTSLQFSGGSITVGSTCTVAVDVTAAKGVYINQTGAVSSTNGGTGVPSNPATLTVNEAIDLKITKTDNRLAVDAGETVSYTIEVENLGPSAATGAKVVDTFPSSLVNPTWTCVAETGASCGASGSGNISDIVDLPANKKATYTITAAVASSTVTDVLNKAVVLPPTGMIDTDESNNVFDDLDGLNKLTITKSVLEADFDELDSLLHYTYVITNAGTSMLYAPFTVTDDQAEVTCEGLSEILSLEPESFFECEAVHTVTQEDLDAGFITNHVSATAKDGDTDTVTSNTATKTVSGVQGPLIGVAKRVVQIEKVSTGTHDVTFEILVMNYGNVTLHDIQIEEDLRETFPVPTSFTLKSLSSDDLAENPGFDGKADLNLLIGIDTLDVGESKTLQLTVTVIPASYGPFENSVTASGLSPEEVEVTDSSQTGLDPDPDADHDPTDNNEPTGVAFDAHLFDPPYGEKTLNDSGVPVLRWTMVWINDTNIVAINARVHDPIPEFTEFVPSGPDSGYPKPINAPDFSTSVGVSCTSSAQTVTRLCYYEGPTVTYPRGQIIWEGTLGPDFELRDPAKAQNAITITFDIEVADSTIVHNEAFVDSDINGDGDVVDDNERKLAIAPYLWDVTPSRLPNTGFAPGRISSLPAQETAYAGLGDLWLEIPRLEQSLPIVGVPLDKNGWDVSWLGTSLGWLNGTAYPSLDGNSVLTGHVYLPNGKPGPLLDLKRLRWNDQLILHIDGLEYVYQVRQVRKVKPEQLSILDHTDRSWITLLTCQGYNEVTNDYAYRQVVRAVLVEVR